MEIETLQSQLLEVNNNAQQLTAKAAGEKRDLTVEEDEQLSNLLDQADRIEHRIAQLSRLGDQTAKLNTPNGRKTAPEQPAQLTGNGQGDVIVDRAAPSAGHGLNPNRIPAVPMGRIEKNGGFATLGHMAQAVVSAALSKGRAIDPRLERLAAATTYGSENSGSDGGFAVPPDFRTAIMEKVMGEDSLLSRCDQVTVSGNTFSCPTDETTPWQTSGGIQAYWDGEAQAATQSKPSLTQETIKLNKIRALVPVTEELLEDAPAMDAYLRRKAPEKISFKVSLAIIQGNGVGMPLGILRAPSLVSVAKESGQQADTLVANNVIKMYSRMPAANRSKAVWLINQDIEPQLYKLSLPGTDNTGNSVTGWGGLVYTPANGLSGAPYGTLFGRPVVPHQAMETLGDQGDILFADMTQYLALLKSGINPRVEVSMHLWFDQDLMAFKFVLRVGGKPWWSSAIAARDGTATYSPFVTLDERA